MKLIPFIFWLFLPWIFLVFSGLIWIIRILVTHYWFHTTGPRWKITGWSFWLVETAETCPTLSPRAKLWTFCGCGTSSTLAATWGFSESWFKNSSPSLSNMFLKSKISRAFWTEGSIHKHIAKKIVSLHI